LLEPTGVDQTVRGAFPVWEYKQIDALLYGVDVDYAIDVTQNLKFNTGFSYIYGQDTKGDRPIINMPAPNFRSSLVYEKEKWNLRVVNNSVFKQVRFPANNFETSFIRNEALVTEIVDISTPPNGYTVFDLAGSYKMSLWNPNDLTLGISITNIFDVSYRDYLNRQRFYADNIGRNSTININFKF